MKDDAIIRQLTEYIKEERYSQAVLIDGEWGSGKTYFVKEKLMEKLEKSMPEKKIYYISLYGISSPEEIIREIYFSRFGETIIRKLGGKNSKGIQKGFSFTSKMLTVGMQHMNIDTKNILKQSDIKEWKNQVIIFDDLERCGLEINRVFGFVNNLVEHNDIKIILVANQNKIGKISSDGNAVYEEVKEKLVGLTIRYRLDWQEVFLSVLEKYIKEEKAKNYLVDRKQKVIEIFVERKHHNIRTLIFALIAFEKMYDVMNTIKFEPQEYIEDEIEKVFNYIFISAIHIKSGKIPSWQGKISKSGVIYFTEKDNKEDVYGYKFVDDYLLQCKFESNEITEVIISNAEERKKIEEERQMEASLQYNKLSQWWELEDEEIEEILPKLLEELEKLEYSTRYFKNIIIILIQLDHFGFNYIDFNKYIKCMIKKVETDTVKINRDVFELMSDDQDFVEKYNEITKVLLEAIEKKEEREKDNTFLAKRECWDNSFRSKCHEGKDKYIRDNKFFYYIEPTEFISQLQEAKVKEIVNFISGVESVYSFTNLNDVFQPDIFNLKIIIDGIDGISNNKITKKLALERLLEVLTNALQRIEAPVL